MKISKLVNIFAMAVIVGASLGAALPAFSNNAAAAGCDPPSIMFGRYRWCGYFYNKFEDHGDQVRDAGVPAGVNNVQDFINLIENDYKSGDVQKVTGAVFVVREMIGVALPSPPCALGTCKGITAAQFKEFEDRLKSYGNTSQNGTVSTGSNGRIEWFHSDYMHCGDFNTYYQNTYHDIAPYIINDSNTPQCNDTGVRYDHIMIYNKAGGLLWKIRRPCMNPIGTIKPLTAAPDEWALTSSITATSGATPLTSGTYVQAGDPITFTYRVNNSKADTATGVSCQAHANNSSGWKAVPAPETTGPTPPGVTCKSSFPAGASTLGTETIASAPNDTSVCRSLIVSPSTPSGGTSAVEVCVYVSSRPYFRVYGGDVSAGNPQSNACTATSHAGLVSWSKDLTSYAGAGTRYAALAMDKIYDFSTNMGNAAGTATTPSGLAFSNTGATGDTFGGNFGSLPCMTDFYAMKGGASFGGGNVSSLGTGTYTASGPITINGNINPNQRTVLYVNGDVTIGGNITYPGSWNLTSMPMFQLVVSGNIYIDKGVTQLDGMYVAQANATPGTGTIYTCTNLATPYTVNTSGTFNVPCSNKLTVNGAFIAKQVQLLRTKGTVKQSATGEASSSANQAEVFNYTPAVWMVSPPNAASQAKYDSITSLPPIL
ncbi:MAG TPA: hypothetical protein VLF62_04620 [Candidatus Saccharimonadales bacterium]|nr:hypothetical protein [Candidatus Saccharimonadales bacterium]